MVWQASHMALATAAVLSMSALSTTASLSFRVSLHELGKLVALDAVKSITGHDDRVSGLGSVLPVGAQSCICSADALAACVRMLVQQHELQMRLQQTAAKAWQGNSCCGHVLHECAYFGVAIGQQATQMLEKDVLLETPCS